MTDQPFRTLAQNDTEGKLDYADHRTQRGESLDPLSRESRVSATASEEARLLHGTRYYNRFFLLAGMTFIAFFGAIVFYLFFDSPPESSPTTTATPTPVASSFTASPSATLQLPPISKAILPSSVKQSLASPEIKKDNDALHKTN